MAKHYEIAIDQYQVAAFLEAVRTKRDIIFLWMNAIKAFLANNPAPDGQREAHLSIVVMSMSRLFCELKGGRKIFSVAFPFSVRSEGGEKHFFSREGIQVDNFISSQILALIEDDVTGVLGASDFYRFIDPIIDAIEVSPAIWALLRELMLAEEAYIRYDWDEERAKGHLHPVHHLDLGYSNSGTFKVGLSQAIDRRSLVHILNTEVDCHYLLPASKI